MTWCVLKQSTDFNQILRHLAKQYANEWLFPSTLPLNSHDIVSVVLLSKYLFTRGGTYQIRPHNLTFPAVIIACLCDIVLVITIYTFFFPAGNIYFLIDKMQMCKLCIYLHKMLEDLNCQDFSEKKKQVTACVNHPHNNQDKSIEVQESEKWMWNYPENSLIGFIRLNNRKEDTIRWCIQFCTLSKALFIYTCSLL